MYCERSGPGLWAEPLNVSSNVAFLVAAWLGWRFLRRSSDPPAGAMLLPWLIAAIGMGSALFHAFRTPWAHAVDVSAVLAFELAVLWIWGRRVLGLSLVPTMATVGALGGAVWAGREVPPLASGSLGYVPNVIFLAAIGIRAARGKGATGRAGLLAGILFALALGLRAVDATLCPWFPLGTHFLWHMTTAAVAYLVVRVLLSPS